MLAAASRKWSPVTKTGKTADRTETPGRAVAELMFGFWRFLLDKGYQPTLSAQALRHAFPGLTPQRQSPAARTASKIPEPFRLTASSIRLVAYIRAVVDKESAMGRSSSTLLRVAIVTVAATVLFGWVFALEQLLRDGWIDGGGTAWMLGLAAAATAAAALAFAAHRAGRPGWAALALMFVAVSPTVFAYVLNLAVLVLAVVELVSAISNRRQPQRALHGS